jgi:hypothetical protein
MALFIAALAPALRCHHKQGQQQGQTEQNFLKLKGRRDRHAYSEVEGEA